MKSNRGINYGHYSRNYSSSNQHNTFTGPYNARKHFLLGDTRNEPRENYRIQQRREYGERGDRTGAQEERYNQMYDISNYAENPRASDYGLPYGVENNLKEIGHFPYGNDSYAQPPRHHSYNQGYNPNYDNPIEGDRYRSSENRDNHGFRHEIGYGIEDNFREFGNDRYGYKPF